MPRIIVITNPAYDIATDYLDAWLETIQNVVTQQTDIQIHELRKQKVTREEFEQLVDTQKPQLILFNGHGSHDSILGFDSNILIKCGDNTEILKNKIVHSLACDCGKTLGPEAIRIGSQAFIGFKEEFKFAHRNKTTKQEQLTDDIASLFFKPAYGAITEIVNGATAEEAYKKSQKMHLDILGSLLTSNDPVYRTTIASRVYHNLNHQVILGDRGARF